MYLPRSQKRMRKLEKEEKKKQNCGGDNIIKYSWVTVKVKP